MRFTGFLVGGFLLVGGGLAGCLGSDVEDGLGGFEEGYALGYALGYLEGFDAGNQSFYDEGFQDGYKRDYSNMYVGPNVSFEFSCDGLKCEFVSTAKPGTCELSGYSVWHFVDLDPNEVDDDVDAGPGPPIHYDGFGARVNNTFEKSGEYIVQLIVDDVCNMSGGASETIFIEEK